MEITIEPIKTKGKVEDSIKKNAEKPIKNKTVKEKVDIKGPEQLTFDSNNKTNSNSEDEDYEITYLQNIVVSNALFTVKKYFKDDYIAAMQNWIALGLSKDIFELSADSKVDPKQYFEDKLKEYFAKVMKASPNCRNFTGCRLHKHQKGFRKRDQSKINALKSALTMWLFPGSGFLFSSPKFLENENAFGNVDIRRKNTNSLIEKIFQHQSRNPKRLVQYEKNDLQKGGSYTQGVIENQPDVITYNESTPPATFVHEWAHVMEASLGLEEFFRLHKAILARTNRKEIEDVDDTTVLPIYLPEILIDKIYDIHAEKEVLQQLVIERKKLEQKIINLKEKVSKLRCQEIQLSSKTKIPNNLQKPEKVIQIIDEQIKEYIRDMWVKLGKIFGCLNIIKGKLIKCNNTNNIDISNLFDEEIMCRKEYIALNNSLKECQKRCEANTLAEAFAQQDRYNMKKSTQSGYPGKIYSDFHTEFLSTTAEYMTYEDTARNLVERDPMRAALFLKFANPQVYQKVADTYESIRLACIPGDMIQHVSSLDKLLYVN